MKRDHSFVKLLLTLSAIGLATAAQATDYTWTASVASANWASSNWTGTPAVNAATGPVGTDNAYFALGVARSIILNGDRTANNIISYGTAGWTLGSTVASTTSLLTASTVANYGSSVVQFRNGNATALLNVQVGDLILDGTSTATLRLGDSNSLETATNYLNGLTVSGETRIVQGTANFNVRNETNTSNTYSLGLLNMSAGTANLNYSYVSKNAVVNLRGLTGAGGTVVGATTLVGGVNTGTTSLVITATGQYSSGTILSSGTSGGVLALTKAGAGTQTLTGSNTYSGGTAVTAGMLLVGNSAGSATGSGSVTVSAGAVLGGNGTVAPNSGNNVSIAGSLAPGLNNEGVITFNLGGASKLDFVSGAVVEMTLGTSSDRVAFTSAGDWLSGSGNASLNLGLGTGFSYGDSYVIFQGVTTAGFSFANVTGYDTVGYTHNFNQVGNNYVLSFAAVPEPGTVALFGVAGFMGLIVWRRNRR